MKQNIILSGDRRMYPVLICNDELFIVDMNETAREKDLSKYLFTNVSTHISLRDASTLRAFLRRVRQGAENIKCVRVPVEGFKGGSVALVTIRSYFGKDFFEFSLFRSNAAILSESNPMDLLLPGEEYPAEYFLSKQGADIELTAIRLNRLFASGFLSNLYRKASRGQQRYERFDVAQVTRLMVTRVGQIFDMIDCSMTFSFRRKEVFFSDLLDMSDFINIFALMMALVSGISVDKKVRVCADCGTDTMKIYFDTELKEPSVEFVGDFSFILIGESYPAYSTFADVIKYMCELSGISVHADIEGERSFTAELVIGGMEYGEGIFLHHPDDGPDEELFRTASKLISALLQCNE